MFSLDHLHPMIVHFPIALIIFGFLAELSRRIFKKEVWLSKAGFYLLIFGTLAAIVALLTGELFTSEMSGAAGAMKEKHELFAWITVGLLITTSVLRIVLNAMRTEKSILRFLAFAVYTVAAISVGITGFFGGTLVYSYMMPL